MVVAIKSYFPIIEQMDCGDECCIIALETAVFGEIYPVVFSLYTKKVSDKKHHLETGN